MEFFTPGQAVRLATTLEDGTAVNVTAVPRSTAVAVVSWSDSWSDLRTLHAAGMLALDAGTKAQFGADQWLVHRDMLPRWESVTAWRAAA